MSATRHGAVRIGRQAHATPHLCIINPEGRLIYRGAIDDQPSFDPATMEKARNYVQAALEAAPAGYSRMTRT